MYVRGSRLYCSLRNEEGKWISRPTPYGIGEEELAEDYARQSQALLDERRAALHDVGCNAIPTVAEYIKLWLSKRGRSQKDDRGRLAHVPPALGAMRLDEVRVRHVRALVKKLKDEGALAPRTVLHVYRTLSTMFRTAVSEEILTANPCQLMRNDLPKKKDKNPGWRPTAVYTHAEVETLISDCRVPPDRRVLYALLALTGARFGEVAALRWSRLDRSRSPLASLHIFESHSKEGELKDDKEEKPRLVPVHPTLAAILDWWYRVGWAELLGREPKDGDLIIPSRRGNFRSVRLAYKRLQQDLKRLQYRGRRTHDLRRTFISLALGDGARKDILRWVTHGPEGDIMDLYTTLAWESLCEEVAKLRIAVPAPRPPEILESGPLAANSRLPRDCSERFHYSSLQSPQMSEITGESGRGGRDSNPSKVHHRPRNVVKAQELSDVSGHSRPGAVVSLTTAQAIRAGDVTRALELTERLRAASPAPAAAPPATAPRRKPGTPR